MKKKLAREIKAAQATLHDEVGEALGKFTDSTGLSVPAMAWCIDRGVRRKKRAKAVVYWDFRSDLRT